MELKRRTIKKLEKEIVDTYEPAFVISLDSINTITDTILANDIKIRRTHMSNTEEQPEHFSRSYDELEQFYLDLGMADERMIEEFGYECAYKNYYFALSFNINKNEIVSYYNDNLNIQPLLNKIEEKCQKKSLGRK